MAQGENFSFKRNEILKQIKFVEPMKCGETPLQTNASILHANPHLIPWRIVPQGRTYNMSS